MRTILLIVSLSLSYLTQAQRLEYSPTKSYHVNSAQSNGEERGTKMDDPFEIVVTTNKINIGDKFDLEITNRSYRNVEGWTIEEL